MNSTTASAIAGQAEIRELAAGERQAWDDFVRASPHGTFFHLSGWKAAVEEALGHRCHFLLAKSGDRISGVFPISHVKSVFGDCLVSLPLAVYGGICADDQDSWGKLLAAGDQLGRQMGAQYLEMRNLSEPYESNLPGKDLYVTFLQDLTAGPDALLKALPRDTRYAIRKSLKAGLEWTEDVGVTEFYDILAENFRHLGTPIFSKRLFIRLQQEFPRECRIFGVRKGGRLIASVLCFYFRDQVIPYYAGSLPEYFADAPNNFMYWKLICQSYEEGLRTFDFGRSKRGTGSFQFKSSWSMEVKPLPYRYQLMKAKEVPRLSPVDGKFRVAVRVWKRLPLNVTKVLGPAVIRWIPSV
jgi:FemAB-related protein (PEP-CTERM system-associated)